MGIETWLIKVKKSLSHTYVTRPNKPAIKKSKIGVLAFEIATITPKLNHLWQDLSDENMARLRNETICIQGVYKLVSTNDAFLLSLACAEIVENVKVISKSVSRLSERCQDSKLRGFETLFEGFANTGRDPYTWILSRNEMEANIKKMGRYVAATATLHREIDELTLIENSLRKLSREDHHHIQDFQQKLHWQKQKVKFLKSKSLWNKTFDTITSLLARSIFTILSRIKHVFNINRGYPPSASAMVYPSDQGSNSLNFVSGPLTETTQTSKQEERNNLNSQGFFETSSRILKPSSTCLGSAALPLHYANLIIVTEKMIRSPQLVGFDARDDVYSMLPKSIRASLRDRLRGIGFTASDPVLAGEWREALGMILGWLSPLAHNMLKWQNERSFEHQNLMPKTGVLLVQTLFFADQQKTEDAITELLVGLNYIWRFDNAQALLNCTR